MEIYLLTFFVISERVNNQKKGGLFKDLPLLIFDLPLSTSTLQYS